MLQVILFTAFISLFYITSSFWIDNIEPIASSFFGAMGGAFVIWFISYINKIRNDYDEINYTIRSVLIITEHTINFIKGNVKPRIDTLEGLKKQIKSPNQNTRSNESLDVDVFYKKMLFEDVDHNLINIDRLKFTLYKDPNLAMILIKLKNSVCNLNLCKNQIHDFIDKDMGGEVQKKETYNLDQTICELEMFEEQNENLSKLSKSVLFFGEIYGLELLQRYNKKHYGWFCRRFLRILGSGHTIETSWHEEYRCYLPEKDFIKGYDHILKENNDGKGKKSVAKKIKRLVIISLLLIF